SSTCVDKSEMDVAPRGRASSAAVMSRDKRAGSSSKWRTMRCRSESWSCTIWYSQCTSSTYGLPRNLQNTVAPSMALYPIGLSLPNRVVRAISLMVFSLFSMFPATGGTERNRIQYQVVHIGCRRVVAQLASPPEASAAAQLHRLRILLSQDQ